MLSSPSARLMIAMAITLLAPIAISASPSLMTPTSISLPDTFEVHFRDPATHNQFIRTLIDADDLDVPGHHGLAVLKRDGSVVAVFPIHQIGLVINRSLVGTRTFQVRGQGLNETISADRISQPAPNIQTQSFWVGDRLSAVAGPNAFQLIVDESALIRSGG